MAQKNQVDINVRTKEQGASAFDRVVHGLKQIKEQGGAASKAIDGFVGLVSGPLAAITGVVASVAAAFSGLAKAVHEYAKAEEGVAKLDAALAQHGILTDEVREKYQDLATELANVTAIGDDEWLAVLKQLTQFGAKPETIGMDVEAVKNLAGIVGDLGTATSLYSKALAGNYAAFSRYGIIVSETADKTAKLKDLQQQLAIKGGGQLEASANSLSGKFRNLRNQLGEVTEGIGQQIVAGTRLGSIVDFLAGGFEWWAEKLGSAKEQLEGIRNSTGGAAESSEAYAKQLSMVAQLADKVTKATNAQTEALRNKQRAEDEITDARLALNLALVDDQVASGKMTQQAGAKQRSKLRIQAASEKFQREQQTDLATIKLNERALSDLLATKSSLESRRSKLQGEIAPGSRLERLGADRAEQVSLLERRREDVLGQPIGMDLKARTLAEIEQQIAFFSRPSVSVGSKRQELAAVEQTLGTLGPQIDQARTATLTENTGIAQRMAVRDQVNAINQQREGIGAGVNAVVSANQAAVDLATQFLQISRSQEARLRQLENQAKNALNR